MFENKRIYQKDQITKWIKKNKNIRCSKTMLVKRLGITRPTLYKLLKSVNDETFTKYYESRYRSVRTMTHFQERLKLHFILG